MEKIKWGIIGPGSIANNFADGLKGSYSGQLVGIASKNDDRRKNFGDKYDIHPCLLYTSPSPRDGLLSRMPSSA